MRVGWIGAGRMGSPMALRAAKAGHAVRVYAQQIAEEALLRDAGATICSSPAEAVRDAEIVCLCLFDDAQTRGLVFGEDNLIGQIPSGAILAVHSTGSAALMRELAAAAGNRLQVIDAPFSGQMAGELTILMGGSPSACETAAALFAAYATRVMRVGALGAGQRTKLVNQFLFRANAAIADTALRILEGEGQDRREAVAALAHCSGRSFALENLSGTSFADLDAALTPYFDAYLLAAGEDHLSISPLLQCAFPNPEFDR